MRFLTKMVNSILSPTRLCQTQYDSKDQESKVHTLSRVDDDAHPGAAKAPAWKCVQEDTTNDRPWDTPGLVKVVEAKEHPVCYPAPPAKYTRHLGQQHTPKEKLLSQDSPRMVLKIAFTTNRARNHQAPASRSSISCDSRTAPRLYPSGSAKKGKSDTHRPST